MKTDIAIIGAGPAGLAAAQTLAPYDLDVTLIDEQPAAGGQIFRQPPAHFRVERWLPERIYRDGKALLRRVSEQRALHWKLGATVLGVSASGDAAHPHALTLAGRGPIDQVDARQILIAAGCYDMPVCFPGAILPGVMATGGIQAFVKSQQITPGERFVFVGTHPLQLIVADQVQRAGGVVVAVIFAQRLARFVRASASLDVLGQAGKMRYIAGALARLRRAGVPIRFGETVVSASGDTRLVQASFARASDAGDIDRTTRRDLTCDRLGLCFGFLASSELARQAGAAHRWSANGGGWICEHDAWMRAQRPGVFMAGEITGVAGADKAMESGRLAALGMLRERGVLHAADADRAAAPVRRRLERVEKFAQRLRRMSCPAPRLLEQMLTADSIVCKCEEVTAAALAQHLAANPTARDANAVKLGCRTGMGLCQGRYCNYYVTQILSQRTGLAPADIGPFTAQWPVKPVRIGSL